MGSKTKRNTLKIISATSMTVFSLAVVFAVTLAWFAMNEKVGGDGMNVGVAPTSGRLSRVYFHSYNDSDSTDEYFEFNKTSYCTYTYDWANNRVSVDKAASASDWELDEYTALDHDHPILILFEFDKDYTSTSVGDIFIKGNTTVDGYLGARISDEEDEDYGTPLYNLPQDVIHSSENPTAICMKKGPGKDYQGQTIVDDEGHEVIFDYYALSSVASFRYKTFSEDDFDDFDDGTTYAFKTVSETPNEALIESEPFADVNNAEETYTFNQTPYLYKSDGSSTIKYIALIVEYSPDAIGFIYTTYLGDSTLESWENILRFTCDWSLEVY